jgi:WD40 repeat protein
LSSASLRGAAVSKGLLASADAAGVVRFIDLRTWTQRGAPVELGQPIEPGTVTFSPDGRTLAVATRRDGRSAVHLIDVESRATRRLGSWGGLGPTFGDTPTTTLAYAPRGRRLAVGLVTLPAVGPYPASQRLLLLDARSGRTVWQRRFPHRDGQWEYYLQFLSGGRLLTSAQQGETLVWNTSAGRIVRRYPIGGRFALSPDRRRIAIALNSSSRGDPSSSLTVLDLRTGTRRDLDARLNESWIGALAYTRDGKRIVAAATDITTVWDVAAKDIVETYGTRLGPPPAGVVVDRRGLALDSRIDGTMTVWDPGATRRVGRRFSFARDGACFGNPCYVVAPQGDVMASSRGDGTVTLVDLRARRRIANLPARDGTSAEAMAFTADGRRLATGGNAGTVTILDVRSRAVVRRLRFRAPVSAVSFSPDGRLLAVQHKREEEAEATVEVRRLRSTTRVFTRRIAGVAGELAFTRDGRMLVASACCATVVAWDPRSGEQRLRVPTSEQANTFALSPDSQVVAAGSSDGRVRLWDLRTGRPRGAAIKVAEASLAQLAISPDGRLLAASAMNGTAAVWDLRSRTRLGDSFPVVKGLAPQLAFKPDGRLIVGEFVSAIEWPLDRPTLQRFACQVAGRDITRAEWEDVLPNQPYGRVCD